MSELTVHQQSTDLTIGADQSGFTDQQISTLRHIGVEDASQGDLAVFFHVCQRTGLDPFARQIYMIGRKSKGTVKQTIQTGIDGYRLIGRRAADRARVPISVSAPQWADRDGNWRDLWLDGLPAAAKVTITRDGEPFTAVAIFNEYKQTTYQGDLTAMWKQRPAGQIAKCAEALAWRMAFPQDLAGVYVEDEMGQADSERRAPVSAGRAAVAAAVAPDPQTQQTATEGQIATINGHMEDLGMAPAALLEIASEGVRRTIAHPRDLTAAEAGELIAHLRTLPRQSDDANYGAGSPDGNADS